MRRRSYNSEPEKARPQKDKASPWWSTQAHEALSPPVTPTPPELSAFEPLDWGMNDTGCTEMKVATGVEPFEVL